MRVPIAGKYETLSHGSEVWLQPHPCTFCMCVCLYVCMHASMYVSGHFRQLWNRISDYSCIIHTQYRHIQHTYTHSIKHACMHSYVCTDMNICVHCDWSGTGRLQQLCNVSSQTKYRRNPWRKETLSTWGKSHMDVYMHVFAHVCVCIYIYIHMHLEYMNIASYMHVYLICMHICPWVPNRGSCCVHNPCEHTNLTYIRHSLRLRGLFAYNTPLLRQRGLSACTKQLAFKLSQKVLQQNMLERPFCFYLKNVFLRNTELKQDGGWFIADFKFPGKRSNPCFWSSAFGLNLYTICFEWCTLFLRFVMWL
jgi:hypothetical protein